MRAIDAGLHQLDSKDGQGIRCCFRPILGAAGKRSFRTNTRPHGERGDDLPLNPRRISRHVDRYLDDGIH